MDVVTFEVRATGAAGNIDQPSLASSGPSLGDDHTGIANDAHRMISLCLYLFARGMTRLVAFQSI